METLTLTKEELKKIKNKEYVERFRLKNPERWAEIQRNSYKKNPEIHIYRMREYRKKQKEENENNKLLSQKYKELMNMQVITI